MNDLILLELDCVIARPDAETLLGEAQTTPAIGPQM
jgi:hypothetical protein